MTVPLSPGVLVVERDLTNSVPAVATSIGGYVGPFQWGPAIDPITITSELELVKLFGKPDASVAASFFSAANFLSYSNNLKVVRVVGSAAKTAVAASGVASITVSNPGTGYASPPDVEIAPPDDPDGIQAEATASLESDEIASITVTVPGTGYTTPPEITISGGSGSGGAATAVLVANDIDLPNARVWENSYSGGQASVGPFAAKYIGSLGNSLKISVADVDSFDGWEYESFFDFAPGTSDHVERFGGSDDEIHVVIVDENGRLSGVPGTILERFSGISKAHDARATEGGSNYYKDILANSRYVWWMDHIAAGVGAAWGSDSTSIFGTLSDPYTVSLWGGVDDNVVAPGDLHEGWDVFRNKESVTANLLFTGPAALATGKYVIENIADVRKDCIVCVSPSLAAVQTTDGEAAAIIAEREDGAFNVNSSYGFMDTGWKYQYDKYNDTYRYVPLNADVAGCMAFTDSVSDPWHSPAGYDNGQIKNVVRLAYSPSKADRDALFKKGINPVITIPGEGHILYGDKTLLAKTSAFSYVNVRRLFIVIETALESASLRYLFKQNSASTRAQFRNMVEPFLRDIVGREGILDFRLICDSTNNTGEVTDRGEFIADIYIKPIRSIRFITLNFIATRTDVSFEEIVGN